MGITTETVLWMNKLRLRYICGLLIVAQPESEGGAFESRFVGFQTLCFYNVPNY